MKTHSTDDLVRSMARVRDESLAGSADGPAARNLVREVMALAPSEEAHGEPVVRRAPRRLGVRLMAAGALAAVAVGAIAVRSGEDGGTAPAPSPVVALGSVAEAGHVLDLAAAAAENRRSAAPGLRQWVYTKMRLTTSAERSGIVSGGPYRTSTWELWRRGDGKQYAAVEDGRIRTGHELVSSAVAARFEPLPDDPGALLRKVGGGGHEMAYETLITILRDSVHAPETEAAIFRAIKRIPGVTPIKGKVDLDGRPAIALGRTVDGWLHEEVLLDPKTYAYLGERAVAIKTRTFESDGEPTRTVKAGTLQRLMVRIAIGVVDGTGRRS